MNNAATIQKMYDAYNRGDIFDFDAAVRQTGKRIFEQDEVHIFYFDNQGKVIRFRHRADTHQQFEALRSMERPREMGKSEIRPTM